MAFHTLIEASDLRALLEQNGGIEGGGVAVIDCRFDLMKPGAGRIAYREGHIPGALYADLNQDLAAAPTPTSGRHPLPSAQQLAAAAARWRIGPDTQVVAYDAANAAFAARLWWLMRWAGHVTVAVLNGGLQAWLASGGGTQSGDVPYSAAPRDAASLPWRGRQPVIGADELARALADGRRLLVDARTADRYAGTAEPIDAKAGHVPGAVNHPFAANIGADNRFLAAPEMRRLWLERLGSHAPADVVAMCGSGVTACHNLLSLEVAGLPGAALYPGSWSEWIRDPARPIAGGSSP